jgi:hypothetical protein
MRFMMIMFPKDYENAKPGWVPDLKSMEKMGKYNEQLGKAGVLLALDGLTPPSTMSARVYRSEGSGRRLLDHPSEVARRGTRMGLAHPRLGQRNGRGSPDV